MHASIAAKGITQAHPDQSMRVQRSDRAVAARPATSAPSAAVAVQPYQYMAGARDPRAGSTMSFCMVRAEQGNANAREDRGDRGACSR